MRPGRTAHAPFRVRLVRLVLAEPPRGGRGTHIPWGESRTRRRDPSPSPTAHLAGRTGALSRGFVVRPSFHPPAIQRDLGRNLALDLVAALGVGVTAALISTLLPTIARRSGLEPIGLAALAAAPFVANLLSAFAGRVGPRSPRMLAVGRGAGAAALLILAVAASAPVLIIVSFAYWLSLSMTSPFQLRIWGSMYPARVRG